MAVWLAPRSPALGRTSHLTAREAASTSAAPVAQAGPQDDGWTDTEQGAPRPRSGSGKAEDTKGLGPT